MVDGPVTHGVATAPGAVPDEVAAPDEAGPVPAANAGGDGPDEGIPCPGRGVKVRSRADEPATRRTRSSP
eukprot:7588401-Prorocentrum_lima.AAC.1